MIATGGVITGLAALKRQDSARSQHHLPPPPSVPQKRRPKRKPKADVVIVRGKIRLYSPSGFFLFLGIFILMVGIAMAVLGYWPQKAVKKHAMFPKHLNSEKMKMLGPFTMGIGIFIFICANAILHENRDKETKVIQMRDIYSTVIDIHNEGPFKEDSTLLSPVSHMPPGDPSKGRSRQPSMASLVVPSIDINDSYKPRSPRLLRSNSTTTDGYPPNMSLDAPIGIYLSPSNSKKEFGSNSSLHMLSCHSKSLDLEGGPLTLTVQAEQRKHPSWPRLDRSNSKGYVKLENKEDPMDRLLVPHTTVKRDFTNKEKLLMISRSHNNLSFESNEFLDNKLRRGASETRF
uniref:Transmembrane protein 200A n=1 Tax=Callorhinchus milii TaxID=7868 RepID=A0A4W3IDD4_CALMI